MVWRERSLVFTTTPLVTRDHRQTSVSPENLVTMASYNPSATDDEAPYKCQKCELLFDSADAASSHEAKEHYLHECVVCRVLRFQTVQELAHHQRTCGNLMELENDSVSPAGGTDVVDASERISLAGKTDDGNTQATMSINNSGNNSDNNSDWTTVWTCDICKEAQFESYEEALKHEENCGKMTKGQVEGGPTSTSKVLAEDIPGVSTSLAPIPPPKTLAPPYPKRTNDTAPDKTKAIILFSPILEDSSDSLQYYQISKYHRLVLKSLQLRHIPQHYSTGERIGQGSFHCQFCGKLLSASYDKPSVSWSMDSIVKVLPSAVLDHLCQVCEAAPKPYGEKLSVAQASQSSGRVSFDKFLLRFFAENGITVLPDDVGGVAVLHDDDFMKNPQ